MPPANLAMGVPLTLCASVPLCLAAIVASLYAFAGETEMGGELAVFGIKVNVAVAAIGYLFTYHAVPSLCEKFIAAGLFGIDLNKSTTKRLKDGSLYRDPETNRIQGIKVPEVCSHQ